MNPSRTTVIVAACLLAAVFMGMWLGHLLPVDQLSPETRDTVSLTMGLVATMSALVLGLLVDSSKASYEATRTRAMQKVSKYALLDRVLAIYGPQAAELRGEMHALIEQEARRLWPDDAHPTAPPKPQNQNGNDVYLALLRLETRDDTERALKAQAVSLMFELGQLHSLMETEATTSIFKPMLVVVVHWLVMIFLGFSLIAPPTATATLALIAAALCAAGAIFMILELDRPFSGLIRISSEPMWKVLDQLGK